MNMREPFASTAMANLLWDENQERAIDRIAASGRATELGLCLWKARYQNEGSAYQKAIGLALDLYSTRYKKDAPETAMRIVVQTMREYLANTCRTCRGVGEMMISERLVVCEDCGGSRIHRYSDEERARLMKLSYAMTKHIAYKISWLLGVLGEEDRLTNAVMMDQLR